MTNQNVPEGSVIIPPYEVFNEVRALTIAVRDLIASDKADTDARTKLWEKMSELDRRVGRIETKLWFIAGIAAALGGGAGAGIASTLHI